ncbi:MAG: hypothetical protein U0132_16695 [Gemmatimonadaceae bacterium]
MQTPTFPVPSAVPVPSEEKARFRQNLIRVMSVQVVTLVLLWFLQTYFSH